MEEMLTLSEILQELSDSGSDSPNLHLLYSLGSRFKEDGASGVVCDVGIIIQSCPHFKAIVDDVVKYYVDYKDAYAKLRKSTIAATKPSFETAELDATFIEEVMAAVVVRSRVRVGSASNLDALMSRRLQHSFSSMKAAHASDPASVTVASLNLLKLATEVWCKALPQEKELAVASVWVDSVIALSTQADNAAILHACINAAQQATDDDAMPLAHSVTVAALNCKGLAITGDLLVSMNALCLRILTLFPIVPGTEFSKCIELVNELLCLAPGLLDFKRISAALKFLANGDKLQSTKNAVDQLGADVAAQVESDSNLRHLKDMVRFASRIGECYDDGFSKEMVPIFFDQNTQTALAAKDNFIAMFTSSRLAVYEAHVEDCESSRGGTSDGSLWFAMLSKSDTIDDVLSQARSPDSLLHVSADAYQTMAQRIRAGKQSVVDVYDIVGLTMPEFGPGDKLVSSLCLRHAEGLLCTLLDPLLDINKRTKKQKVHAIERIVKGKAEWADICPALQDHADRAKKLA
jgi:hypothetical protein